jgi:hypothetical protein
MRYLILIFSLTICLTAKSQLRDTIFLRRIVADTPYHFYNAIYIDTINNQSRSNYLSDFSFNNFDSTRYFSELDGLKSIAKTKYNLKDFPRRWVLLYKYKGVYYTYVPSERGEMYRFEITDSTTIDYTMEGPEPSRINKITRLTPSQILISRSNYWKGESVEIKIIDTKKGIAVFTFSHTKYITSDYKFLMVSVDKISKFKTIINYCVTDKVPEFEFDTIDFSKLY